MWLWSVIIGVILFVVLLIFEFIYLSNHFKAKRAKQDMAKHRFDHAWLGRSGTGYIGVAGQELVVYKTPQRQTKFALGKLFVFTQKTRVDFNTTYGPLTAQQQLWGVILTKADFADFTHWLTNHGILVTPLTKLMADIQAVIREKGTSTRDQGSVK
ncbi:hypothetical protein [Schleiferilactobacillus harbinensis]|uniref:hypothetical protein n=1 Tax=Schleiferilactobacillus harbinensis TaxID=304207 RepID=UPI0007BAA2CC|nr:hypothetical protein [Schleiferilactobacillus harbinensis]